MTKAKQNEIDKYLGSSLHNKFGLVFPRRKNGHWVINFEDGYTSALLLEYCPNIYRITACCYPYSLGKKYADKYTQLNFEFSFSDDESARSINWAVDAMADFVKVPDWLSDCNITPKMKTDGLRLGEGDWNIPRDEQQYIDYSWTKKGMKVANKYFEGLRKK